jgi:hypothetical protein
MAGRLPVVLAALALALFQPAAGLAQSSGDDQYSDPFGQDDGGSSGGGSAGSGGGTTGSPGTPETAGTTGTTESSGTTGSSGTTTTASAASARDQLPRTGLETLLVGGAGVLVLASGVALRLRLRDER